MARIGWQEFGVSVGVVALIFVSSLGLSQQVSPGLTMADLQTRLRRAQSETELDAKTKQDVVETYQAAIERFEIASEADAAAKKFQQQIDQIPDDLVKARTKLAGLPAESSLFIAPDEMIDSLERQLQEHRRQVDDPQTGLRAIADTAKKELASRKTRLEEISRDLMEIDERLRTIQELMDAPVPEGQSRELTNAIQVLLQVRKLRADQERSALRAEQTWCGSDDANELLRIRRDVALKELELANSEVQMLQAAVDKLRGSEADQRVRAARQVLMQTPVVIKPLAEQNLKLAEESRELAGTLHATNDRADTAQELFNALKAEFDQSKTMVEAVGLTESIGLLLRQQRAKLSDTRGLYSRLALRSESVRQTRMRLFQIESEVAALQDLESAATRAAHDLFGEEPGTNSPVPLKTDGKGLPEDIQKDVQPLLEQRLELLERLYEGYGAQFEKLVLLDNNERKLLDLTELYTGYIDERVLWIRTGGVLGRAQVARIPTQAAWLVDKANWRKVVEALQGDVEREPLPYAFAIAGCLLWLVTRWSIHKRLQHVGLSAADPACQNMAPTLQALALTLALAAFIPAAILFFSWRIDHCASTSRFVHAVALGLRRAFILAVPLEFLRLMSSRGGLAERHFDWSAASIRKLRRHLAWFAPLGISLVAMIGLIEATSDDQRLDGLGRMIYVVFACALTFFCHRAIPRWSRTDDSAMAAPVESLPSRRGAENFVKEEVWVNRLARIGSFLMVTIPVGLLILCWTGYFYTALQLTWRLQASAWLVLGLLLLRGTIRRWITLERRRMAILQAEELKAIVDSSKHPGADAHSQFLFPRWTWPDFRLNLTQIVTQVRSLLDTGLLTLAVIGLWFVWADVTPALNILDRVTLWQTTTEEVVESRGADDKPIVQLVKRPMPITAANLGLAVLIMSIAIVAGRNIPGLVEVILLEHLSVDAGIRFATTCLVRYVIFIMGVVLAFNEIGIGWNSVQWLVAAASVGLGFGLQEIFANFVSGIILLFERPMRVGDVITIGDTTGTVSRIRFRATTIVDGDRKELIVPNKSFITGNLLNWTLSDSVNRIAVKVGVAYGSDADLVRKLLLKIASDHPSLLKEPAPTASLEILGDSSLVFQLRAFLPTLKDRLMTIHELNTQIHDRFREARIEIPFPQQDINIRTDVASSPINPMHGPQHESRKRAGVTY